jgi:hypothetical protein
MKKMKIPKTDSIKALAHFFDTHDMGDFESELVEATEPVFAPRRAVVVRLEPRQMAAVRKLAKAEGISDEELVRQWILHNLAGTNGRDAGQRKPTIKGGRT